MEVSGQLHVPAALPRDKRPRYPSDTWLGASQSRSGRGGKEKKSHHTPCRELNPSRPAPKHSLYTEWANKLLCVFFKFNKCYWYTLCWEQSILGQFTLHGERRYEVTLYHTTHFNVLIICTGTVEFITVPVDPQGESWGRSLMESSVTLTTFPTCASHITAQLHCVLPPNASNPIFSHELQHR
jgi:hypothetical protein